MPEESQPMGDKSKYHGNKRGLSRQKLSGKNEGCKHNGLGGSVNYVVSR